MFRLAYDPEVTMLLQSNLIEGEDSLLALSAAMRAWDFLTSQKKITHAVLLTTHTMLMDNVVDAFGQGGLRNPLEPKYVGNYRDRPVWIGGRSAMNSAVIRPMLEQVFAKLNERRNLPVSDEARELYARGVHVQYERVHPFLDGNGRTGRMLYNWHRLGLKLPVQVINSDDDSRREYYSWFKEL